MKTDDTLRNFDLTFEDLPSAPRQKRHKKNTVAHHSHSRTTNKRPAHLSREFIEASVRVVAD